MGVLLTAKFKIHNPSRRKREAMDTALEAKLREWEADVASGPMLT